MAKYFYQNLIFLWFFFFQKKIFQIMQSRIIAQRQQPVLLLDVDTQTTNEVCVPQVVEPTGVGRISEEIGRVHMSLVSRISELELQNADLQDSVDDIKNTLCEFKRMWEAKTSNEKQTDVLLRNIGVIS